MSGGAGWGWGSMVEVANESVGHCPVVKSLLVRRQLSRSRRARAGEEWAAADTAIPREA
ncbi:hypothetical protein Amsp01_013930 [Amycolatopsis sp. NBRC 101858]|nr:hypothetical protein Amsp01_013930 [Amycolatopsis sp. NBRC 101858]